jgi:hypothetical protein
VDARLECRRRKPVNEAQLINEDIRAQLSQLSKNISSRRVAGWLSNIETLRGQLIVNVNRKVATDNLFLQMANN